MQHCVRLSLLEHYLKVLDTWRLVRVSPDFRVIALGLPVPRYTGSPLDPPLRSRFQARDVKHLPFGQQLEVLIASAPSVDRDTLSQILSFSHTLLTGKQLEEKIIKATTLSQCFFCRGKCWPWSPRFSSGELAKCSQVPQKAVLK